MISLPILHFPAPASPPARAALSGPKTRQLIDSHGRVIRDLRLSVTDRCNFRCVYCMDPDVRFMDRDALLTVEELTRVTRVCADLGVERIRLTGGEPAVRPGLREIIAGVSAATGAELSMTTNGSIMDRGTLDGWRNAGLRRITISLDSVRPDRFARITRSRASSRDVIAGAARAKDAGLEPVKINAVIVRGFNEDEVVDLADLARDLGVEMRFIEYMPLDSARAWDRSKLVPASEIIERIEAAHPLAPRGRAHISGTALLYDFADGAPGAVGVIAPVTRPFCGACSRLRITSDGKVRPCLFSRDEFDLRPLLRGVADDDDIAEFLMDATWTKQAGHGVGEASFVQPDRPMSAIGG